MPRQLTKGSKLTSVRVLGKRIRIQYSDIEEWGLCDNDQLLIILSKKCINQPEQHWLTLIHEATHMIFRLTGVAYMDRNEEEAYVRCVENLVIPWLLQYNYLRPEGCGTK